MTPPRYDSAVGAQAAAWLARLRSEERTGADEAAFRAWLAEDVSHRQAFDLVNTAWEIAGGAVGPSTYPPASPNRKARARQRRPVLIAAGAATAVAVTVMTVATWMLWPTNGDAYATGVGEEKRVALADGSVMVLDTSTAVEVSLRPHRRSIELLHGRAHFVVAKDRNRPFVVSFDQRQVVAVGTTFDVMHDGDRASVLLTNGKVVVKSQTESRMLTPGDRVSFRAASMVADRPDLESLTAWQSGRAVFSDEPLKDAIAEMNRYSSRPIVVEDPAVGELRISGSYKTSDAERFVISVATLLPISVHEQPNRIVLDRQQSTPAQSNQ